MKVFMLDILECQPPNGKNLNVQVVVAYDRGEPAVSQSGTS